VSIQPVTPLEPKLHESQGVLCDKRELPEVGDLLRRRNVTFVCGQGEKDEIVRQVQTLAEGLGQSFLVFDLSEYFTSLYFRRPLCVIGSLQTQPFVQLTSALRGSPTQAFPPAGKGLIRLYQSFELTQAPVILVGGNDEAGTGQACALLAQTVKALPRPKPLPLQVWTESPMRNVFPWSRNVESGREAIRLSAARGEMESAVVVATAHEPLTYLSVKVSTLEGEHPNAQLPLPQVLYAYPRREYDLTRPDVLLPREVKEVPAGFSQPVWINFVARHPGVCGPAGVSGLGSRFPFSPLDRRDGAFLVSPGEPRMLLLRAGPSALRPLDFP
jgi:hypothetical protein